MEKHHETGAAERPLAGAAVEGSTTVMNARTTRCQRLFVLLMAASVLIIVPAMASAQTSGGSIVLPESAVDLTGQTYGEWSAEWWQYVLSFPTSTNPLLDPTGADCAQRQTGNVFFLVGSFIGPVVRDQCHVPGGQFLFFPLVNIVDVNVANQTADELFKEVKHIEDGAHDLHASVDGVPVPISKPGFRTMSPAFSVTLKGKNLFGLKPGTYSPAVADGYYLLLTPLPAGAHTITFGGTDGTRFTQDITYHLVVDPTP